MSEIQKYIPELKKVKTKIRKHLGKAYDVSQHGKRITIKKVLNNHL